jgi:hypothetical protein
MFVPGEGDGEEIIGKKGKVWTTHISQFIPYMFCWTIFWYRKTFCGLLQTIFAVQGFAACANHLTVEQF